MSDPIAVWHVVARLCMVLPTSPNEGFACEASRWQWYEGQPHQIEAVGHELLAWRDLEMWVVLRPGVKPEPPPEPPGLRQGVRVIADRPQPGGAGRSSR